MKTVFITFILMSQFSLAQTDAAGLGTSNNAAGTSNNSPNTAATTPATLRNVTSSVPISIMPWSPMDMNNFVIAGTTTRSESAPFIINLHLNCFKSSVAPYYPVATTTSEITFHFSLKPGNGPIAVRFPGSYLGRYHPTENPKPFFSLTTVPGAISGSGARDVRAAIAGNTLRIEIPVPQIAVDPANPSTKIPKVADDFFFESTFDGSNPKNYLAGGPPSVAAAQQSFSNLYQAPGSYSADLEVNLPAGNIDPSISPLTAVFRSNGTGPAVRQRTNILDCEGTLSP